MQDRFGQHYSIQIFQILFLLRFCKRNNRNFDYTVRFQARLDKRGIADTINNATAGWCEIRACFTQNDEKTKQERKIMAMRQKKFLETKITILNIVLS